MSRAAVSKSRADKGSKPPPAHTPVVAHEIVPGKFTDQDWYGNFCYVLSFSIHLTWIWNIMWFKTLMNCWYQYFANDNWVKIQYMKLCPNIFYCFYVMTVYWLVYYTDQKSMLHVYFHYLLCQICSPLFAMFDKLSSQFAKWMSLLIIAVLF